MLIVDMSAIKLPGGVKQNLPPECGQLIESSWSCSCTFFQTIDFCRSATCITGVLLLIMYLYSAVGYCTPIVNTCNISEATTFIKQNTFSKYFGSKGKIFPQKTDWCCRAMLEFNQGFDQFVKITLPVGSSELVGIFLLIWNFLIN
jgi:hypothetical protein